MSAFYDTTRRWGFCANPRQFFYALAFFWLDGFAAPIPARVTQTVGWLAPKSKNKTVFESQVSFNNIGEPQKHG